MDSNRLPPGQQLAAPGKWPLVGERDPPQVPGNWEIIVSGLVEKPLRYSLEVLRKLPQESRTIDVHCVTRWSMLDAEFAGIPLNALLALARPLPTAQFISFNAYGPRHHSTSLPIEDARQLDVLVALSYAGKPLAAEHGGPIRSVTPGRYFYKSVKWLNRIELLDKDRLGFWEASAGYHNRADPWREERFIAGGLSKRDATQIFEHKNISKRELLNLDGSDRDLTGLQASEALLRNANFQRTRLVGADFRGANLSNARFNGCDLHNANFAHADLEGANFSGSDLRGADLRGASLFGTSFVEPQGNDPANPNPATAAVFDATTRMDAEALDAMMPLQAAFVAASRKIVS